VIDLVSVAFPRSDNSDAKGKIMCRALIAWCLLLAGIVCIAQSEHVSASWQSRDSNYNQSIASSGTWTPQSLSNKFAYYDATVGVTLSGSNVTAWADQFNSNNFNTLSSSVLPTFSATACNSSHPAVVSGASNNSGISANPASSLNSTTLSVWMLLQVSSFTGSGNPLQMTIGGNPDVTPNINFITDNTPEIYALSGGVLGNGGAAVPLTAATPHLFGVILDGAHANLYLDARTPIGSPVTFTSTIGNGATFLQMFGDNTAMCNLIITTGVMNSTDISNLFTWENTNWGTSF
jgi:hypothetical protein